MKRLADLELERWKNSPHRKPLLLRGARQVGKTYAARKLGKKFKWFIEINFEMHPDIGSIFKKDLDATRIARDLSYFFNTPIEAGKTLLFFDEVQEQPEVITSLRYFYEQMPELHLIAAGSLVDFAFEKIGLPVGRVSSLHLFPMSFIEFLWANDQSSLIQAMKTPPLSSPLHDKLLSQLGEYFAIGGMPESVVAWIKNKDPKLCYEIQQSLIDNYQQDFQKYAKKNQIKYVETLFKQIPSMIGQRFKYSAIHGEYRKRELAPALDLLSLAGVVHKIHHTSGQGTPLGSQASSEKFKVIFLDIALTQVILGNSPTDYLLHPKETIVNNGQITEAFVGQELLIYASLTSKEPLYYWLREVRNSSAEVDYLIKQKGKVLPIEVKSGSAAHLKSLQYFLNTHSNSTKGLCVSTSEYNCTDRVDMIPLYAIGAHLFSDRIDQFSN